MRFIDCANVEMQVFFQIVAEAVDEGDYGDVQVLLVHIDRTRAVDF